MKAKRQAKILEIISTLNVETQEQLLQELQAAVFLYRDIAQHFVYFRRRLCYISNMSEEVRMEGQQAVSVTTEFEIPPECCVVFYNDDYTTKDFVVEVLETIFAKSRGEAVFLMEQVHSESSAVVGVYTYDIAVTRAGLATAKAKKAGFPLKIEVKR